MAPDRIRRHDTDGIARAVSQRAKFLLWRRASRALDGRIPSRTDKSGTTAATAARAVSDKREPEKAATFS